MKTLTLPGSKSITNRDFILAALSNGISELSGILVSDDTKYMIAALKSLGLIINDYEDKISIDGGINKIEGNNQTLFLGNSGTCTRFLTGLAILNNKGTITIDGTQRMRERPIQDLIVGLRQIGAHIEDTNGFCPLKVYPSNITNNIIKIKGDTSSQYITSILQIAPLIKGGLTIEIIGELISKPYIDITISEMNKFGVSVTNKDYKIFTIQEQNYIPQKLLIEGDASALSYIIAFLVINGGQVSINNIGNNTKQGDYRFLTDCKIFGVEFNSNGNSTIISAPGIKNINLKNYKNLNINYEDCPDISMTFMILSIFLPGVTHINGLKSLNVKECKRIDAMKNELLKLGIDVKSTDESIDIGEYDYHEIGNIDINTYDDHRIAMCFGVLKTIFKELNILNPECVNKTYPKFWEDIQSLQN